MKSKEPCQRRPRHRREPRAGRVSRSAYSDTPASAPPAGLTCVMKREDGSGRRPSSRTARHAPSTSPVVVRFTLLAPPSRLTVQEAAALLRLSRRRPVRRGVGLRPAPVAFSTAFLRAPLPARLTTTARAPVPAFRPAGRAARRPCLTEFRLQRSRPGSGVVSWSLGTIVHPSPLSCQRRV